MTENVTLSKNCYAALMRIRKANINDITERTISFSQAIMSVIDEKRLLEEENLKLQKEMLVLKDKAEVMEKTLKEYVLSKEAEQRGFWGNIRHILG